VNGFDLTASSPIASAAIAAYAAAYAKTPNPDLLPPSQFKVPGGLLYANSSNRDIYHTQSHIFSPRFGFAWTPSKLGNKTVIRGGFGVFMFPIGVAGINQTGFSQQTSLVASLDSFLTPHSTLGNPFPDGIQQPTGSSLGLATNLGKDVTFFNPNVSNPYSLRWDSACSASCREARCWKWRTLATTPCIWASAQPPGTRVTSSLTMCRAST